MKERHRLAYKQGAIATLHMLRIPIGADFHALAASQVEKLLAEADRTRYQKPKLANGSRARYFHDLLQRQARIKVR